MRTKNPKQMGDSLASFAQSHQAREQAKNRKEINQQQKTQKEDKEKKMSHKFGREMHRWQKEITFSRAIHGIASDEETHGIASNEETEMSHQVKQDCAASGEKKHEENEKNFAEED